MKENKKFKEFNVTFTELKKYNPATRTVKVQADNDLHAISLIRTQFGSALHKAVDKKIKIDNVDEVKIEKEV